MLDMPLYRFRNAGDFIPHLPKIITVLINRTPRLQNAIANRNPHLLQTLSEYCHVGSEYLIEKDYQIRQLDQHNIGNAWQWVQLSKILLPQLRFGTQEDKNTTDVKNRLRELIKTLIQASLLEHRAYKYVDRLNFGELPHWVNFIGMYQ